MSIEVTESGNTIQVIPNNVIVEIDDASKTVEVYQTVNSVEVTEQSVAILEIVSGPPGPPGPPGPSTSVFYTHTQGLPSTTWVIQHNLDGYPTAVVFDSSNSQCEGTFSYQNNNQMTITFTAAFSGTAYVI